MPLKDIPSLSQATKSPKGSLSTVYDSSNAFPSGAPEPVSQGFFSKLASATASIGPKLGNAGANYLESTAKGMVNDVGEAVHTVKQAVTQPGSNFDKAQAGFQAAGDVAHAALEPVNQAISGIANALAGNKAVQKVANSPAGDTVAGAENAATNNPVAAKLAEWAQQHPEAAKDLGALGQAIQLGTLVAGTPPAAQAVGETTDAIPGAVADLIPKSPEAAPAVGDTVASRIADATPTYNKNMVGQYVKTPDTLDAAGNVVKEGPVVPRVNEGQGLTGERPVTTSASEHASGTELDNIKNYPDNGTALQKSQAVYKEISSEANNMRTGLAAEDKANPLNAAAEKEKVTNSVLSNLPPEVQQSIADEKALPKTAAGKYYQTVLENTHAYDGSRVGKLALRQANDAAYETARGKLAWGSDSQNAIDETNADIRTSLNKDLAETTKNTDTKASLEKQSNLYRAKDVLDAKAKAEAPSRVGRFMQAHPVAKFAGRQLERQAIRIPLEVAGVTALGAYLHKQLTK